MSELISSDSCIQVNPDSLIAVDSYLGPRSRGVFRIPGFIRDEFILELMAEMDDDRLVPWEDSGDSYANNRGVKIVQNHDVFALKLSAGDRAPIERVPAMSRLAVGTEVFIRSLSSEYPSLINWTADEMSYHRYYDKEVGLSYHRDNERFTGLIAVVVIDGESEFRVIDREEVSRKYDEELGQEVVDEWFVHSEFIIPTRPGDLVLTRATGLYPDMVQADRPEHAVVNVVVLPRISFMLRDNSRPDDTNYGFRYVNWP